METKAKDPRVDHLVRVLMKAMAELDGYNLNEIAQCAAAIRAERLNREAKGLPLTLTI
jgi:hypothetical protein